MSDQKVMLDVQNLKLYFRTHAGPVQAVDDVSFKLRAGHTLAVVGESGCGKTSLAKAILRLLPRNISTYSGSIVFDGKDIMKYNEDEFRRKIRWCEIASVPQASMNSLNPVVRIEDQLIEPLLAHDKMSKQQARARVAEVFEVEACDKEQSLPWPWHPIQSLLCLMNRHQRWICCHRQT